MRKVSEAVKEKPILFSSPMVRAILDGRKSVTRRIVKWKPYHEGESYNWNFSGMDLGFYMTGMPTSGWVLRTRGAGGCWNDRTKRTYCPYGQPGDRLWVRETWAELDDHYGAPCMVYRADKQACHIGLTDERGYHLCNDWHTYDLDVSDRFRPSIHMPRWASRLTLEITEVRVERVQDITEEDAIAEGVGPGFVPCPHKQYPDLQTTRCVGHRPMFIRLWNEINGKGAWHRNDWTWVIGFRRLEAQ